MTPKIIFIEGNPGSGKTTFAKRLAQSLTQKGFNVKMYQEGDLHPIDLAWCAILTKDEYQMILNHYPMLKDDMMKLTQTMDDLYVVAYTKVNHNIAPQSFYQELSNHEIYRSPSLQHFKEMHLKLWNRFVDTALNDTVYIFECVFIQNHINELILKFNLDKASIIQYFKDLITPLEVFNPYLIFIEQKNVEACIQHISHERKTDDSSKFKDWFDMVIDYFESMPYSKYLNYTDYTGIIQYFIDRQALTIDILKSIKIRKNILELYNDYNDVYHKLECKVLSLLKHSS